MRGTQTFGGGSAVKAATITDFFSNGAIWYKETADMVFVMLKDLTLSRSTASAGSTAFATGLPAVDGAHVFVLMDWQGNRFIRCSYKSDGKLYIHYPNAVEPSDIQFYGEVFAFKK